MPDLIRDDERRVLEALAGLADTNPFLPDRIHHEEVALGSRFTPSGEVWHVEASLDGINPNLQPLLERMGEFALQLRERMARGARPNDREVVLYEGLVRHYLYVRFEDHWYELIAAGERGESTTAPQPIFDRLVEDVEHLLRIPGLTLPFETDPAWLFAWGYQIRRAFHHTFRRIYGASMPAARLRAAVWQSIFTHDTRRYRRALFDRMGDIPTLILGESGTGKELVARAIALSRHIPFDARKRCFTEEVNELFHPLNVAALSPTLVESELFGHRRGSFTGAVADRAGWLEGCQARGTVFLDEIGELDSDIQLKLLRVLESRSFQRIGEVEDRRFLGKLVSATNRDLELEIAEGRFRQDFYYRLCADVIHTPSLREQLADCPDDLENLALVIARRVIGRDEAPHLAAQTVAWIDSQLGRDYAWPGNVRELEQCVRNMLIRGEYRPAQVGATRSAEAELAEAMREGGLSAEELLRRYCTLVYAREGSYEAAARTLGLDRRTVKAKIDEALLAELSGASS